MRAARKLWLSTLMALMVTAGPYQNHAKSTTWNLLYIQHSDGTVTVANDCLVMDDNGRYSYDSDVICGARDDESGLYYYDDHGYHFGGACLRRWGPGVVKDCGMTFTLDENEVGRRVTVAFTRCYDLAPPCPAPTRRSVQQPSFDARRDQQRSFEARRDDLTRALVSNLPHIETSFNDGLAHLPVLPSGEARPAAPVFELLGSAEGSLLNVLNYPELTALRDSVKDHFLIARTQLGDRNLAPQQTDSRRPTWSIAPPATSAVFAGWRHAVSPAQVPSVSGPSTVPRQKASLAFDGIINLLSRLRKLAESNDLVVDLCIRSSPVEHAAFSLHPKSYSADPSRLVTNGKLPNVYRGLYVYKVERDGRLVIDCGWTPSGHGRDCALDLVDDSQALLLCNLDLGSCQRRAASNSNCVSDDP